MADRSSKSTQLLEVAVNRFLAKFPLAEGWLLLSEDFGNQGTMPSQSGICLDWPGIGFQTSGWDGWSHPALWLWASAPIDSLQKNRQETGGRILTITTRQKGPSVSLLADWIRDNALFGSWTCWSSKLEEWVYSLINLKDFGESNGG